MLTIRLFNPNDVHEIGRLTNDVLRENYPTSFFLSMYDSWHEGFLVATNDGAIVGFILGVIPNIRQARILMLAVREEYRRTGIAKVLLRAFMSSCILTGIDNIILEVRVSNLPAINLYEKLDFKIVEKLQSYYRDGEDGYRMMLILRN